MPPIPQMRSRPERYGLLGPGGRRLSAQELDTRLMDMLILENVKKLGQHGLVSVKRELRRLSLFRAMASQLSIQISK